MEAVYCTGIKYGTYKNWVKMFNRSIDANPAEQNVIWQALACNRDKWILKRWEAGENIHITYLFLLFNCNLFDLF